jgi:hypothetical protein
MKKKTMAAVALFCITCVNMLFTSCSVNDNPVVVDETSLSFIESDFYSGSGIAYEYNMINYGEFHLFFKADKPIELKESDFTVKYQTEGAVYTPAWPLDDISEKPEIIITEPFLNSDDQWVVTARVLLACMVQSQHIDITLNYKGKQVGDTMRVDYVRPYSLEYEGSTDGFLYVGQTYPIKMTPFAESNEITNDNILAVGHLGMNPGHADEFEVKLNKETGVPYVKILDSFTFTSEEMAAGYALICPSIMLKKGLDRLHQVVPVKVPANV